MCVCVACQLCGPSISSVSFAVGTWSDCSMLHGLCDSRSNSHEPRDRRYTCIYIYIHVERLLANALRTVSMLWKRITNMGHFYVQKLLCPNGLDKKNNLAIPKTLLNMQACKAKIPQKRLWTTQKVYIRFMKEHMLSNVEPTANVCVCVPRSLSLFLSLSLSFSLFLSLSLSLFLSLSLALSLSLSQTD